MESKKPKFLMLTNHIHRNLLEGEDCLRTGLYSWIPVFDGDVKSFQEINKEELKDYDIIHINLSTQDIHLVKEVRKIIGKDSKTKIVVNNDYTVELWLNSGGAFEFPYTLAHELEGADMIFGTEPNMVGTLEVLTGRKVHLIVHPGFIKRLKTLRPKRKLGVVSVVHHRYDNNGVVPGIALRDLGYPVRLIGYDKDADRRPYVTETLYKYILPGTNFMDFCDQLLESEVVVDPFLLTSQSRVGWDCAALGVPLVGSDRNYSVQQCFPYTMSSPLDAKTLRETTKRLLVDKTFKDKVVQYAFEKVEMINYDNSRAKYLEALKEGSPEINL
jgi:hypothetical protein